MASPNKVFKQFPMPEASQLLGFLASCPVFTWNELPQLELLASELKLVRYDDGARLYADQTPDYRSPLRFVVQGRATWDPSPSAEQKGAWMLTPGSVFGLEAVNDWALRHKLEGAWSRGETSRIRCQAIGVLWVLELPADRFDAVFLPGAGRQALSKLLHMVPTSTHAPDIVAAMRANPQFARTAPVYLYKLLEWAPASAMSPIMIQIDMQNPLEKLKGPTALYYVIEGELKMWVEGETKVIQAGEIDGADLFASPTDTTKASKPIAMGDACVVMLTRDAIETCMRYVPGLARTLGPHETSEKANP